MPDRIRLGMLTPSSNTVLEPVSAALVAGLPEVSVHFGRFRVVEISLRNAALGQFDMAPMLGAAELLADAKVDAICWNGTSAGWMGLDSDRRLCAAITERTGIPATSAVLSLVELFRRANVERFGLVSPYTSDVQSRILETMAKEGFVCTGERHAGESRNFHFADVTTAQIEQMVTDVAETGPEGITVLCTNMDAAMSTPALEMRTGITMFDSIATSMWGALTAAGVDPRRLASRGRLFML